MPRLHPNSLTVLLVLLAAGCGNHEEQLLPYDASWCSAESASSDPLPALFDGLAGPERVAEDYVLRDRYSSGIAIATVSGEGARFYTYGQTRWDGGLEVDPDTTFELGSITKVFTSLLLADAVVRGELDLTDRCTDLLPAEVQLPESIELWHLATHSSGLPRDAAGFTPGPYDSWYQRYTIQDLYAFLDQVRLSSDPGTRWSYSNLGANLLGHILSLRTGMTYEELLTSRVLAPLGMTSTYLYQEPAGTHLATPYARSDQETDYFMVPVGLEGAGRIRSTARDMARFAEAAMGLRPSSLDPAFALGERLHFRGDDASGNEVEQGLGWGRGHAGGSLFVGHGGGTWGFTTSLNLDLDRRYGTIVLTNSRHARDCLPGFEAYWLTAWQKMVVLDAQALSEYPGEYSGPAGPVRVSMSGSHLFALLPGQGSQRIHPEGNDRFFSLSRDVELRFVRGADDRVSGVSIRTSADPAFPD